MNTVQIFLSAGLLFAASLYAKKAVKIVTLIILGVYLFWLWDFSWGWQFPLVNISVMLALSILLSLNKRSNFAMSTASFFIYSIVIDIVCWIVFPTFRFFPTLPQTVLQGLIFNLPKVLICLGIGVVYHFGSFLVKCRFKYKTL